MIATLLLTIGPGLTSRSYAHGLPPFDFELAGPNGFVKLSDPPPKPSVVNFWRSDCPPCRLEIPTLAQFASTHRDWQVYAVAMQASKETAQLPSTLRQALNAPIILLHAPRDSQSLLYRFGNRNGVLPFTMVLNASRQPCQSQAGAVDHQWLEQALQQCAVQLTQPLDAASARPDSSRPISSR